MLSRFLRTYYPVPSPFEKKESHNQKEPQAR
jgi:hypothetical protein